MTVKEYLIKNYDELNTSFDGICIDDYALNIPLLLTNFEVLNKEIKDIKVTDTILNTYIEISTK